MSAINPEAMPPMEIIYELNVPCSDTLNLSIGGQQYEYQLIEELKTGREAGNRDIIRYRYELVK